MLMNFCRMCYVLCYNAKLAIIRYSANTYALKKITRSKLDFD